MHLVRVKISEVVKLRIGLIIELQEHAVSGSVRN